jgi:hypothetical protein
MDAGESHRFWSAGSGSRRAKITDKKKSKANSCFGYLDVLFEGLKGSPLALTSLTEHMHKY